MQTAADLVDLAPHERGYLDMLLRHHPGRGFQFYNDRISKALVNPSPQLFVALGFAIGYQAGADYTRFITIQNLTKCKEN